MRHASKFNRFGVFFAPNFNLTPPIQTIYAHFCITCMIYVTLLHERTKRMAKKKISAKYIATAHEYIKDWNISRAMIASGYSDSYAKKNGYRVAANIGFKEYVSLITSDLEKEAGISKLKILTRLSKIVDNKKKANTPYVLKSIELLAKMLGYFEAEKKAIEVTEKTPDLSTMTYEQLKDLKRDNN